MPNSPISPKDQIQEAIEDLHRRESGDHQTLRRQVAQAHRKIQYNVPQLIASLATQKELYLEWGRGTGKTTFIGDRIRRCTIGMPRSTGLLIGPTYQAILTRIVPSLVQGLEMQGLYQNLHYFIGELPPRSWRSSWGTAYQPPSRRFDKYITFWNGTGMHLISHDVPGDGRGLNSDWEVADESAMLKYRNLAENTDPTDRGSNALAFKNHPLFASKARVSSTPLTPEGRWFIDKEEQAMLRPSEVGFISADSRANAHNLRPGYLEDARKRAWLEWVYLAEYLNKRPKVIRDGFYALLDDDIHAYYNYDYTYYTSISKPTSCKGDADLIAGKPLILGADWGAVINSAVVSQHVHEYRALKDFYVLGDEKKIQDDLLEDIDKYYRPHQASCNLIYLWYDNTGNVRTGITKRTRAEMARDFLNKRGWNVQLMTRGGANPEHDRKHLLWTEILKETNSRMPKFRVNKGNCHNLWISMTNAKAKQGSTGIAKDKSSERSTKIERQFATDLSDAIDAPIYGMFSNKINQMAGSISPNH